MTSNLDAKTLEQLQKRVDLLGLTKYERHIFLCADQTNPKCCTKEIGIESWNHLKQRLSELKLSEPNNPQIFRSKVNCLRVCTAGPIAVIYPDGVWYHSCTPSVLDKIISEHLVEGRIVKEYVLAINE